MAYKRKSSYANKKRTRRPMKKRKMTSKRSFTKRVKSIVLKTTETKSKLISWNKVELFHNVFSTTQNLHLNQAPGMPVGGGGQDSRIGDRINTIGFKVRMLLGQKGDRPNVNWRYMFYSIPKGSSIGYADVFKNVTGNVLLDEPNRDRVRVLKTGFFRPNQARDFFVRIKAGIFSSESSQFVRIKPGKSYKNGQVHTLLRFLFFKS